MKQKLFYSLLLVSVMTLTAILSSGCTEEEPEMFTTQRIVINYTDSVVDASISPEAKTRSQSGSSTPAGGVLTSKSGKKLYLSCTETAWPLEKTATTRGTKVTTAGISNLGVSASVYPAASSYTSAGCGSYFYKESVSSGTPMSYYWPTTDYRISFFGYYPYNNAAFTVQSAASATGAPTYAYTVPSAIASQQDIMTGQVTDQPGGSSSPVNMTLAHRCSAIHFSVTNDRSETITVNSISIEGVKYSGTLNENTWTLGGGVNSSSTNPFTLTPNTSVAAGATADITGTSNVFLMLPQSLPATAKLKVVVDDEDYEMEITGTWQAGKAYTYTVSFNSYDYYLNVIGPSDYTYLGGTNTYSIQSYKQNSMGIQSPVPWMVTYDTDGDGVFDDAKPSWLTVFTASSDGSTTVSNYNATVEEQIETTSTSTAPSALSSALPVGNSENYYDLSTNGNTTPMTTANCYMVHAPGYYKLPLVYGNALKNGMDNTVAYAPGGSTYSEYCANFFNHADSKISAPWITKSGSGVNGGMNITVDGAQLIWQDVDGLTTDFVIDGDYLKFQVPAASIAEGNAVIAVKSGSTIVWSWHIWVTAETYTDLTTVDTDSHIYYVTPVNLGWVESESIIRTIHEGRACIVKVSQTDTDGLERTFEVTQLENISVTTTTNGNSPFYQWGRKDPFVPCDFPNNTDKTVYVGSGVNSRGWDYQASTRSTIGTTIKNPWKHYYNSSKKGPVNTSYYNMWDAQNKTTNNVTSATKKTIYDPCPPGFCVPTGNLWYYFGNGGSRSDSNWDSTNRGKTWTLNGANIYFSAVGYRNSNSGYLIDVGNGSFCHSATPYNANYGRILSFYSSSWKWGYGDRAVGCSVRPVAEE